MSRDADVCRRIRAGIEAMPFNRLLGVTLSEIGDGRARAELHAVAGVANHAGGVHAAAQYALIEAACGAAATSAFADLVGSVVPLAHRSEVGYRRAPAGETYADAAVDPDEAARARALVAGGQEAAFSVVCEVSDSEGHVVTLAVMRWVLRISAHS